MKKAATKLPQQSEREFQKQVIQLAQLRGWKVAHFRAARVMVGGKETWRTPCEGDAEGFPDLVLARNGRAYFRELKSNTGLLSQAQQQWLITVGGKVWRPEHWPEIERFLMD